MKILTLLIVLSVAGCAAFASRDVERLVSEKSYSEGFNAPIARQPEREWKEREGSKVQAAEIGIEIVRIDENGHPTVALVITNRDGTKQKFYSEAGDAAETAGWLMGAAAKVRTLGPCYPEPLILGPSRNPQTLQSVPKRRQICP